MKTILIIIIIVLIYYYYKDNFSSTFSATLIRSSSSPKSTVTAHDGTTNLTSDNGIFKAVMEKSGNYIIYKCETPIWSTGTKNEGFGRNEMVFEPDGRLVLYGNGKILWQTASGGTTPFSLTMQNTGNLTVYDANRNLIWESKTTQNFKPIIPEIRQRR